VVRNSAAGAPAAPADEQIYGFYDGLTSTGRTVRAIFSGSGEIWSIFSSISDSEIIGGLFYGKTTSLAGKLTASVKDFNLEGSGVIDGSMPTPTFKNGI
jgi:hypothetical protein